ncbi:MAG TPA: hypothetical protein DCK95_06125 [Anaerolineaceae bacterium]|nr:hypothetical protein [Anaerolineaceae bacterium]
MKKKITLLITFMLLLVIVTPTQAATYPTISILSVVEDESVTISTNLFPKKELYYVYMGLRGTMGINGTLVTKLYTGDGGSFKAKFYIPEELMGEEIISIRLESQDSPYYSYDWFYNATGSSGTTTYYPTSTPSTTYIPNDFPTFTILKVEKGESVKIETKYFPANDMFGVYMKDGVSTAKTWYYVAGINSADGGSFEATFNIPTELQWKEKIAIKFYNLDEDYITYNLFDNKNYP